MFNIAYQTLLVNLSNIASLLQCIKWFINELREYYEKLLKEPIYYLLTIYIKDAFEMLTHKRF